MAEFSLPALFVVPVGNTLPTSGSTESLTQGQFGIFKDEARTVATAANISTAKFIQLFQGRPDLNLNSKSSDKIKASNVTEWYKIQGQGTASNEIWAISDFTAKCNEEITLTVVGHSRYLDTISFNGLTRSITVKTPCCDCGGDPCAEVPPSDMIFAILETIVLQANAQLQLNLSVANNAAIVASMVTLNALSAADYGSALTISTFFTFTIDDDTTPLVLTITSKAITQYGKFCNIALNSQEWDRIWFRTFVYKAPATTQDFIVFDDCDSVATITLTQRSTFAHGLSNEIYQLQVDNSSYQLPFKHLFQLSQYNQYFEDLVTDGVIYDLFYIQFNPINTELNYNPAIHMDERVIIAVPQTTASTVTPTGNTTSGSAVITNMSALTNVAVGATITGAGIPANSIVVSLDSGTQITISQAATATATGVTLTVIKSPSSAVAAVLIPYLGAPEERNAANTPTTTPLIP